jgi:hypothetical protein
MRAWDVALSNWIFEAGARAAAREPGKSEFQLQASLYGRQRQAPSGHFHFEEAYDISKRILVCREEIRCSSLALLSVS